MRSWDSSARLGLLPEGPDENDISVGGANVPTTPLKRIHLQQCEMFQAQREI